MTVSRTFAIAAALGTMLTAGAVVFAHSNQDHNDFDFGQSTTLWTPPLIPLAQNSEIDCYIINVSKKPRFVVIDVLNRDAGTVVDAWRGVLEPGHEAVNKAQAGVLPRSCRFAVEGNASHFRASGLVVLENVGSISALPAE